MQKDTSRYQEVMNSFSLCVLTNSGFARHAKFSKEHGHPEHMTLEKLEIYHQTLNDLRDNNLDIYKRLYSKLFSLIQEDNFRGEASNYSVFDKVRDFGDYMRTIIDKEDTAENVCANYEKREWWISKVEY